MKGTLIMNKILSNAVWKFALTAAFLLSAAGVFYYIAFFKDIWETVGIKKSFETYEYEQLEETVMSALGEVYETCRSESDIIALSDALMPDGKASNIYFLVSERRETSTVNIAGALPKGVYVDDCYEYMIESKSDSQYIVRAYVQKTFPYQDEYSDLHEEFIERYTMESRFLNIAAIFSAAGCIFFILLCLSAGRRSPRESFADRVAAKMPCDVIVLAVVCLCVFLWNLAVFLEDAAGEGDVIMGGSKGVAACLLIIGAVCVSMVCTGIRNKDIFRNMIVVKLVSALLRGVRYVFGVLPGVVRCILCAVFFVAAEGAAIKTALEKQSYTVWLVIQMLAAVWLVYHLLMLCRIRKAAKGRGADGGQASVSTKGMTGDLKLIADYLNSLDEDIRLAVQEQMKSERLKVELITNVSHDLKTPLTSIINYTDLLSRENITEEEREEYLQILKAYSVRLKRLVEDLLEAAKISSGNVKVHPAECNIGIMMSQAAGEFEDRAAEKNVEIVLEKPDCPINIMADSQYLFRVLENLMSNICKYSLENSRAYLTLTAENGMVYISFKNISKAMLNISPDELMERFVRGDSSRNTEGNGLGLSIAKSLTELQNGTMSVEIEGDMFKVQLCFPEAKP